MLLQRFEIDDNSLCGENTNCFFELPTMPRRSTPSSSATSSKAKPNTPRKRAKTKEKAEGEDIGSKSSIDLKEEEEGEDDGEDSELDLESDENDEEDKEGGSSLKMRDYFTMESEKMNTSDNTLAKLKLIDKRKILQLLDDNNNNNNNNDNKNNNNSKISNKNQHNNNNNSSIHKHTLEKKLFSQQYEELFPFWFFHLSCNFNLLFYGLGSKRNLIERFAKSHLKGYPCIVVYGYAPNASIREV